MVPKQLLPLVETAGSCEPAALRTLMRNGLVKCELPNDKVCGGVPCVTSSLCPLP